ncbi:hypothetical protein GCM10027343_36460 [Noviherbaspirillum agri]
MGADRGDGCHYPAVGSGGDCAVPNLVSDRAAWKTEEPHPDETDNWSKKTQGTKEVGTKPDIRRADLNRAKG